MQPNHRAINPTRRFGTNQLLAAKWRSTFTHLAVGVCALTAAGAQGCGALSVRFIVERDLDRSGNQSTGRTAHFLPASADKHNAILCVAICACLSSRALSRTHSAARLLPPPLNAPTPVMNIVSMLSLNGKKTAALSEIIS
jgi:hypothetical protein